LAQTQKEASDGRGFRSRFDQCFQQWRFEITVSITGPNVRSHQYRLPSAGEVVHACQLLASSRQRRNVAEHIAGKPNCLDTKLGFDP
jgi:hypothetical protein